jgi:hypothetical protein
MFRHVLVFGLVGPLALIGGCASGLTGGPGDSDAPATTNTSQTKQVTLAVSGMT